MVFGKNLLNKGAKFLSSLFGLRKSKKVSCVDDSTAASHPTTATFASASETFGDSDDDFKFDTDPDVIGRGCQLVYPVFGRDMMEELDDYDDCQSSDESEGEVIEFCSWEPDLNGGGQQQQTSTDEWAASAAEAAPEELEHCPWTPQLSELSSAAPVEISLFVWELESRMKIGDEKVKPTAAEIEKGSCLKQDSKSKASSCRRRRCLQYDFFFNVSCFSRTLLTSF